jgi:GntP family gluconate:H+ symporter
VIFSLTSIFLAILWIILGTSYIKWHPLLVLFSAALFLAVLLNIPPLETLELIKEGFGKIVKNIGLLILFGTIIGFVLERSHATLSIAKWVLKHLNRFPLPYSVSCIGYIISIPVFCDAAFVILAQLNKTLSQQTKTPLVGLTVALSTGLFAPHVLIPPTPGPLAAAANLNLENLILLIFVGGLIAFILILVGGAYGNYLIRKSPEMNHRKNLKYTSPKTQQKNLPPIKKAIFPILIPILIMFVGGLLTFLPSNTIGLYYLRLITNPTIALGVGMLFAFRLANSNKRSFIRESISKGIEQAAPIIMITGMGGALGTIIETIPLQSYAIEIISLESLGILVPFAIAALLKTAQGSSTIAIITASSIITPLLSLLGLESDMGKVWTIMAIGVGSMTVSHANDSYFWIVSQMSEMDVKTAYKTHTLGTFFQGMVGLAVVFIGYSIWNFF